MLTIKKLREPQSLVEHRNQQYSSFDNMPSETKEYLKNSLLTEQGYLCCYCMCRIKLKDMRVEHWQCQSKHKNRELDYSNLMAACAGISVNSPKEQHCDVRKADSCLHFNPSAASDHNSLSIRYLRDGTIKSNNTDFNTELNSVLNLNYARIKTNRKKVYDGLYSVMSQRGSHINPHWLRSKIKQYQEKNQNGELTPYCGVLIYFLEKRLAVYLKI